jgi:hypothetical protein
MSAEHPRYVSWKIHDASHQRGGRIFRQSTRTQNAKSTISHRGFHDTKNGGFSTIGRTIAHSYHWRSHAAPRVRNFPITGKFFRTSPQEIRRRTTKENKHMKTITNIIYPAFAAFALCCFAVLPKAQAVTPAPDGFYPGFNTAEGQNALFSLTTGSANTAVGWFSLKSDTDGSFNTAVGAGTLLFNVGDQSTGEGVQNTAVGAAALLLNSTGSFNTAFGDITLINNTTGHRNTALGSRALNSNTTGFQNTGLGRSALLFNTTGSDNVGIGVDTIQDNTAGINNVAVGDFALLTAIGNNNTGTGFAALGGSAQVDGAGNDNTANGANALGSNTTGEQNTAVGSSALFSNTEATFNTAVGFEALLNNTTGPGNTALGWHALYSNTAETNNTGIGHDALASTTGGGNTALGAGAGSNLTDGFNNIDIGVNVAGVAGESNTIRIGDEAVQTGTFIAGISGTAVVGDTVVVDANGQLGTAMSSARFKTEIKPMDQSSEAILALKPVTFRYKHEIDPKGIPQFGLVAEEVEQVNPDLVSRDRDGKPYTVRYEAVNAMLLNEFLKEHRAVQGLKSTVARQEATISQQKQEFQATVAQQQKEIEALTASLKEQASQIQKVSAQLEVSRPAPQTASLPAVVPRLRDEGGNNQ